MEYQLEFCDNSKVYFIYSQRASSSDTFFVLSGVLLGLSLDTDKKNFCAKYIAFIIKRMFRIYPAHFFVLAWICVIIWGGAINQGKFTEASTWYNWYYRTIPSGETIIKNFFLIDSRINPVTWTLVVELGVAFIFPLLHFMSRMKRYHLSIQLVACVGFTCLSCFYNSGLFLPNLYKFYFDLVAPQYGVAIVKYCHEKISLYILFIISMILLLIERQLVTKYYFGYGVLQTIGAMLLISLLIYRDYDFHFLNNRIIKSLGKYSYSFYLCHFPVLWFSYYVIFSKNILMNLSGCQMFMLAIFICVVSIVTAFFLGAICYFLIEIKFISYGYLFVKKIFPTVDG